ncbi:DUF72 domain-containing protein [Candidatus Parcubacteria bacterium]|nr:MAG: DUF72 domain-containing protein [Candidatus Parcubacteria bacterium]
MISKNSGRIHIGTSGWSYNHWKKVFYPVNFAVQDWLRYYSLFFDTVEINNTFYVLPEKNSFFRWRKTVNKDFVFAVKASRYITHIKRLKTPDKATRLFWQRVKFLKDNLGPILFQLPPGFKKDTERFKKFIHTLPKGIKAVIEFRNREWFCREVKNVLAESNTGFCIYNGLGFTAPLWVTSSMVYIRLHGPKKMYRGNYSPKELILWSKRIKKWSKDGKEVYCYFNNDYKGYAVKNALNLKSRIKK